VSRGSSCGGAANSYSPQLLMYRITLKRNKRIKPYISSLKCEVQFVHEKTQFHEKCVWFVPEFIDCANFWSLYFSKNMLLLLMFNVHQPMG
jgi:hypothetical protein